jgi:hypothetical protein
MQQLPKVEQSVRLPDGKRVSFLAEKEKFLRYLESIKTTNEERLRISRDLENLKAEIALNLAEIQALLGKANQIGKRMACLSITLGSKQRKIR